MVMKGCCRPHFHRTHVAYSPSVSASCPLWAGPMAGHSLPGVSLGGQDDHTVFHTVHRPPSAGLPPRLEGLLAWPGPALHACLCHAALYIMCVLGASSSQGGSCHPSAGGTEGLPSRSQDATASLGPRPVNTTKAPILGPQGPSLQLCASQAPTVPRLAGLALS